MKIHSLRKVSLKPELKCLLLLAILLSGFPCSCATLTGATTQTLLTLSESRGKQIYLRGVSPSGKEILAYIGDSSLEMPASAMPCANCHGFDGKGKPEGGVTPSDLTWEMLTKPYGAMRAGGRRRPPYTERALELAITRGLDPAGSRLLNVMPRYVMSKEDLADLILYLKRLGKDRDPGISETSIVIGVTVPNGALAEMGKAVRAVTTAFFDEFNSQGGVYSRLIELKIIETAETPAAKLANIERLLAGERAFALLGAFIAGSEKMIIPVIAQHEAPLIGPITLYPQTEFPLNRQIFYLFSGVNGQARALMDFVARQQELKRSGVAVVYPGNETNVSVVRAIADQSKKNKLNAPYVYEYVTGSFNVGEAIKQLRQADREAIFFLGDGAELLSFVREAAKLSWYPSIFQPGSGGAEVFDAPLGFNGKIFFSVPTSPTDQSARGLKEFYALADKYKLSRKHLAVQFSTYSAAKILVEALRQAGRDVSREKLIQALEGLYQYPTGLTPAITYGPNRRIGATGAYVLKVELQEKRFAPASGWIEIN